MTLPASGTITLAMIQTEFGGPTPIVLSNYYRGGGYVTTNNTSVPTSGTLTFPTHFYGAQKFTQTTHTYTTGGAGTETIPTGASNCVIEVWGGCGGGGQGTGTTSPKGGGGGGSGGYVRTSISVAGGGTMSYYIGAGGAGSTGGTGASSGGPSSVSSGTFTITTITGNGGVVGGPGTSGGPGGPGGTASGGNVANITGNTGGLGGTSTQGLGAGPIAGVNGTGTSGGEGSLVTGANSYPGGAGVIVFYYT